MHGYYNLTGELLQGIYGKICLLHDANIMDACYYGDNIYEVIDELYNNLVGIVAGWLFTSPGSSSAPTPTTKRSSWISTTTTQFELGRSAL